MGLFGSDSDDVGFVWLLLLYVWLAVAVGVAVTRHGLYGIDRLINRTLVYGALTIALGRRPTAIVVLVAGVVFGGSSAVRASLATLVVALAFRPAAQAAAGVRRLALRPRALRGDAPAAARSSTRSATGAPSRRTSAPRSPRALARPERRGRLPPAGDRRLRRPPRPPARRAPRGRPRAHADRPRPPPGRRAAARPGARSPAGSAARRARRRGRRGRDRAACASSCGCSSPRSSPRARGSPRPAYEERRRLERDLHDGAQQRLVTLGIVLRRLQRSLPREAQIARARRSTPRSTRSPPRSPTCARSPPACARRGSTQGLAAALADLARGAGVPVDARRGGATARRRRSRRPRTSSPARRSPTRSSTPRRAGRRARPRARTACCASLVADDGVGGAAPSGGTGLAGHGATASPRRAGRSAIESPPGAGTRIAVELPCAS